MSQFAKEGAAYQPVDHQGKACEGAACAGARVSRTGKIKTRCMNKSNAVLGATLSLLAAVTVLTFVLMDYGDTPLLEATSNALGDSVTMLTQPGLGGHFTLPDLVDGLFVSLALATLTTVLGAVIAFVLGLCAAMNLSNRVASNAIKAVMSLFRAVPTILWVLIFTVAIGLGPEAAVAGLLFHGIAYLTKAIQKVSKRLTPAWWKPCAPRALHGGRWCFPLLYPKSCLRFFPGHSFASKSTSSTLLPWAPLRARVASAISYFWRAASITTSMKWA